MNKLSTFYDLWIADAESPETGVFTWDLNPRYFFANTNNNQTKCYTELTAFSLSGLTQATTAIVICNENPTANHTSSKTANYRVLNVIQDSSDKYGVQHMDMPLDLISIDQTITLSFRDLSGNVISSTDSAALNGFVTLKLTHVSSDFISTQKLN